MVGDLRSALPYPPGGSCQQHDLPLAPHAGHNLPVRLGLRLGNGTVVMQAKRPSVVMS